MQQGSGNRIFLDFLYLGMADALAVFGNSQIDHCIATVDEVQVLEQFGCGKLERHRLLPAGIDHCWRHALHPHLTHGTLAKNRALFSAHIYLKHFPPSPFWDNWYIIERDDLPNPRC